MKVARYKIDGREWGSFTVVRPLPVNGEIWGDFEPIKGKVGHLIPVIEGAVLSEALHGNPYPLLRCIGPSPKDLFRKIPKDLQNCQLAKRCLMHDPKKCHPRIGMPDCFIPEVGGEVLRFVFSIWAENGYVVIVSEGEFSL